MSLLITGCMRSGTMTASKIFGLRHEVQFVPGITREIITSLPHVVGESSWLIRPFHTQLAECDHTIIHIVREPLAVINSLLGVNFWPDQRLSQRGDDHEPYRNFILKYDKGMEALWKTSANATMLSAYYVVYWQKQLLRYPRIRIEDIQNAPRLNRSSRANLTLKQVLEDIPPSLATELEKLNNTFGYHATTTSSN